MRNMRPTASHAAGSRGTCGPLSATRQRRHRQACVVAVRGHHRAQAGGSSAHREPRQAGGGAGQHDRRRVHLRCRRQAPGIQRGLCRFPQIQEQSRMQDSLAEFRRACRVYSWPTEILYRSKCGPLLRALRGETAHGTSSTPCAAKTPAKPGSAAIAMLPFATRTAQSSGAVAIARDITEKKRAEAALRESKELAAALHRARAGCPGHVRPRDALPGREPALVGEHSHSRWRRLSGVRTTRSSRRSRTLERGASARHGGRGGQATRDRLKRADGTRFGSVGDHALADGRRLCGRHRDLRRKHYGAKAGRRTASSRRKRLHRCARRHRDHRSRRGRFSM